MMFSFVNPFIEDDDIVTETESALKGAVDNKKWIKNSNTFYSSPLLFFKDIAGLDMTTYIKDIV